MPSPSHEATLPEITRGSTKPAGAGILPAMRPLCAFDLDHTLVRSPLDLPRLKMEIRALVESDGVLLPEPSRTWTIGQLIEAATVHRPALGAARWALGAASPR